VQCRQTEYELVDVCAYEGVALLPWSPLKVRLAHCTCAEYESTPPLTAGRLAERQSDP